MGLWLDRVHPEQTARISLYKERAPHFPGWACIPQTPSEHLCCPLHVFLTVQHGPCVPASPSPKTCLKGRLLPPHPQPHNPTGESGVSPQPQGPTMRPASALAVPPAHLCRVSAPISPAAPVRGPGVLRVESPQLILIDNQNQGPQN